jgi:hypothetical protein
VRRLLLLCLTPICLFAADPLSPRIANYEIKAHFNPASKTIEGEETITWTIEGDNPLASLQFHLYWNAFRDSRSTFMRESARSGGADEPSESGSIEITSLTLDDEELAPMGRFIHPDDSNADDRTVEEFPLNDALDPNQTIVLHVRFKAKFPALIARAGYNQDFFMAGQWFPKIGVRQRDLWNTHQYHLNSEFFADFGTYNVTLTLPSAYIVAASGDVVSTTVAGGQKTVVYQSDDVHDFAWSAWTKFQRAEDHWRGVRIELYYPPDHRDAWRHIEAAKATLEWFDRNVGPYPYPRLVIVDCPAGAEEAGGMEYPTLVTTTMPQPASKWKHESEIITIHEVGHQYFYGMLASNEFEEAWLDEGINSYTEAAIADQIFGRRESWYSLGPLRASDAGFFAMPGFLSRPVTDPVVQPAWRYASPGSYAVGSYSRPLFLLRTAEELLGREAMYRGLRFYFDQWKFKHPSTRDFLESMKTGSGQDLGWFFQQALYSTRWLDYRIESIHSENNENWVRVLRIGEIEMPVELTLHFEGQPDRRLFWTGSEGFHDFYVQSVIPVSWASINTHAMDANPIDNSYAANANPAGGWKLAGLWTLFVQHLMEIAAWLV